jgi:ABC-type transport system involved in cytochrome c biogenesis permease subunit
MASNATRTVEAPRFGPETAARSRNAGELWHKLLSPLASLKLTVALFAMAIVIILAGTLAQIDQDIWKVMGLYFRTPLARIPLFIFFPRSLEIDPRWAIPFPGGFTIGAMMMLNLLAAHAVRFKAQGRGWRLAAGLILIVAGAVATTLVIGSGSSKQGIQDLPSFEWSTLWEVCKLSLASLAAAAAGGALAAGVQWRFVEQTRARMRRLLLGLSLSLAAGAAALAGFTALLYVQGDALRPSDSSLRILWQLVKGEIPALPLIAGCALVFHKRAGVVLLHAGIGLMMMNELVVYGLHVEGQMQIAERESSNYAQDIRSVELAVVDASDSDKDDVTVVPGSMLRTTKLIQHPDLPFDVKVLDFYQNSTLERVKPGDANPVDAGLGRDFVARSVKPASGVGDDEVDFAAAYVKLIDKQSGSPLGTRLVSVQQSSQQVAETVAACGKNYDLFLRFKRDYKPYYLFLKDVSAKKYMGTNTPKDYSSNLRLVDPSRGVDREVRIWMNNPLRFGGETLYQSKYDVINGVETTGLQIVVNAGWMIPYVACMIVATGMLAHFLIVLLRFLRRYEKSAPDLAEDAAVTETVLPSRLLRDKSQRNKPIRGRPRSAARDEPAVATELTHERGVAQVLAPWIVLGLAAALLLGIAWPPPRRSGEFDLYEFGKLPLVEQGRPKPFDTLARNSLRAISDRDSVTLGEGHDKHREPAIRWLLDLITGSPRSDEQRVFRIQNLDILQTLHLDRREGHRYSYHEIQHNDRQFLADLRRAHKKRTGELDTYEKKLIELENRLGTYIMLRAALYSRTIRPDQALADVQAAAEDQRAFDEQQQKLPNAHAPIPLAVPMGQGKEEWMPYSSMWIRQAVKLVRTDVDIEESPEARALTSIFDAYRRGNAREFNSAVDEYRSHLKALAPADVDLAKVDFEAFFNHASPFFYAGYLYVGAFALTALGWLAWPRTLLRSSFWLILFLFLVHTLALLSRIYISGRPPVTNLYAAAIFVGWGAVLAGLVLEWFFPLGVGNAVASVAGFSTLLIAHVLSSDGDTFTVLQAVLDTQFWLATHVTCITLGYAATYTAGLLGLIYVLRGVFTRGMSGQDGKDVGRMLYGTLCFAIFFSFVGTVLGGLWADDSWGRFWGWDPKENGALIIVLWNALVLHARWDGMVKERGMAVLAIVGNIAVSWSGFGVNQLSVGLHSYGFTEGIALALLVFAASQLAIVGIGSLPKRLWRSFRAEAGA